MSLAGIVLAAGPSSRMGFPKALLDFRGAPFVVRVLEALEALDIKVRVVVLGLDAARIRPALANRDCVVVENPDIDAGPIGSLRAALAALRIVQPTAVLVWPVDRPHVRIATIERLIETQARTGAEAVVPVFGGRRGHPVIWAGSSLEKLVAGPGATRTGVPPPMLEVYLGDAAEVPVDDPAIVDDVDTREDYERLLRGISREEY